MPTSAQLSETYVVTPDGARLRCLTAGNGPNTLVLIPGWTMTADVFEHQFDRLASDQLRIVSFDPRGQGDSTKDWNHHDYDTRGDDVALVVETLCTGPVVLGSWSQGTFEHLSFVRRHGHERTVGAVIIDGAPRQVADDAEREWAWCEVNSDSPPELHVANWIVNPTTDRAAFNREFIAWMLEDPRHEVVEWFDVMSSKTPDGIASLISAMAISVDFRTELALLARSQPTLIVVREEWRDAARDWLGLNAPAASFATMAKHATFWERPDHFNKLLVGFLTESLAWTI